jgi:hypothetical protein
MDRPDTVPVFFQNIRNQESGDFNTVHHQNMFLMKSHNNLVLLIQEAKDFAVQSFMMSVSTARAASMWQD